MILRRLYLYLVSAAALVVLALGLSGLGTTLVLYFANTPEAPYDRSMLAMWLAATIVALPVWGIHQWFARRFARRDPAERASAIRHLYGYGASLVSSVAFIVNLDNTVSAATRPWLGNWQSDQSMQVQWALPSEQGLWTSFVLLVIWTIHYRMGVRDRVAVGEKGASATLRRWYMYSALLIGLLVMLAGTSTTLQLAWVKALNSNLYSYMYLSDAIALVMSGGVLWAFHARVLAKRHIEDDRRSTLRAVEGFIAVFVTIVLALYGGSQILYYSLARILGVDNPGGIGSDLLASLAAPGSMLIVYSLAWFMVRRRLSRDAAAGELARQAAIRRLYTNLASLVSLAATAIGAGGVLWTLAAQVEAPLIGVTAASWRDPLSLYVTLLVVGGAVWLAHWRHAPAAPDRQSLSRRLYLWGALLASVLGVLGYSAALVYSVLQQLLQEHPRLDDVNNLDFGRYLAALVVAVLVGVYHWRVLRSDSRARPPKMLPAAVPAPALAVAEEPEAAAPEAGAAQVAIGLVDWRRRVGDLYRIGGSDAIAEFRLRRDELFRTHLQSPIEPEQRADFTNLSYFAPDPAYRVEARIEDGPGDELVIDTGGADGVIHFRRTGVLVFELGGAHCRLTVLSLRQYAGGLFVPFKDATSGHETYGGGRYLFDTAKNTDGLVLQVTAGSREVVIDFNYAYNPSCVYSPRWACPLAPPENVLEVAVRAGERNYSPPVEEAAGGPV